MLDKNAEIKVTNRYNGFSGYALEDENIQRSFAPNETKIIPMSELRTLSYQPGGIFLMKEYLVIDNAEALEELVGNVEPEYYLSEDEVKDLLLNGDLDRFLDTLDFAPAAIIEMIKDFAVKYEVNDIRKRDAIYEKTGFNVSKAIENLHAEAAAENAESESKKNDSAPKRRVAESKETTTGRRTAAPTGGKYKVLN